MWKDPCRDEEQGESRNDDSGEPRRHVVKWAVGVCAHQFPIINQAQNRYEQHRQEQSIDNLHVQQRLNEREIRHDRHERAHDHEEREDA